MKQVTISDVKRLIAARGEPAISIYLRRDPGDAAAERQRLRELCRHASDLLGTSLPRHRIDALLAPLVEQARSGWNGAKSVAFLRSPGMTEMFALPVETPNLAVVASAFHTKPLVSLLDGPDRFVVLALGDGAATLHEGTPDALRPLAIELPARGEHASNIDWYRSLDDALRSALWDRGDPLVLAGSAAARAAFADISRYSYLLDEGVECDLDQVRLTDLHGAVRDIVLAHRRDVEAEAVAQYVSAALDAGATSDDPEAMCRAAVLGRIRLLLHRRGAHVWGRLDPVTGAARITAARAPAAGHGDIVDDLCQVVLQAGGEVVEVAPERMPTASPVAAIVTRPARVAKHRSRPIVQEVTT